MASGKEDLAKIEKTWLDSLKKAREEESKHGDDDYDTDADVQPTVDAVLAVHKLISEVGDKKRRVDWWLTWE